MDRGLLADDARHPGTAPGVSSADATPNPGGGSARAVRRPEARLTGTQSQDVMSGETLQRTVTITNPQGFHLRPAAAFAQVAGAYPGDVVLIKGDLRVNGKSMLDLLSLVALEGTQLTLQVTGPGAAKALDELSELLASAGSDEDEETDDEPGASGTASLPRKG